MEAKQKSVHRVSQELDTIEVRAKDAAELTAGVGYLGTRNKTVTFREANGRATATKNDEMTVPTGTTRVVLNIFRVDLSYGHDNYIERPLGHIYYSVGAGTLSGTLLTFSVTALLRDINGDDPWEGSIRVAALCFG